jgi:hypothetical protein
MQNVKKIAPWFIRILISFVFFLSAIAKLYPDPSYALTYFEVHQLEPMGIPLSVAQYLSRILIGVEFAIAVEHAAAHARAPVKIFGQGPAVRDAILHPKHELIMRIIANRAASHLASCW